MFRFLSIFSLFLMSQLCLSAELTLEQLIRGTNLTRNIKSGEMRVLVTLDSAARMSLEEAQTWMQKEKERILRKKYQLELQRKRLRSLSFRARQRSERRIIVDESNVAFQIFDLDSVWYPKAYQYKITQIDRRKIDLYSEEAEWTAAGYFHLVTYDGQTQAYEALNEFPAQSVTFFNRDKYRGFQHFELYGRSLNRIPSNVTLVGQEIIAGADCYVLEFQSEEGWTSADLVRVWVDPQKQFCVRKEKRQGTQQPPIILEVMYEDFQKYGEIWFPSVTRWTRKQGGKVLNINTILVKEAQFNLDFPPNFFQVKPQSYLEQGLRLRPDSQVPVGSSGVLSKDKSPSRNKSRSEQALILSCGPNSLLRICELLKIDANFEELARLSDFNPNIGTTMLGLLQAAKYKGLNPKGIKANVKALKKIPIPAIAYVKGNHFLVFEKVVSDGVLIFDPAKKYDHYLSSKELSQIWSGELLIFDYKPNLAKSESVPRVFVDSRLYDFGEALGGSKIKHTFKLKNVGTSVLNILKVEHSCSCTATIVSKDKIPVGEYGIIEAVLSVPSENREVEESIYVYTNDPIQNKVTLILKGTAFVPITTFPTRVFFGKVPPKRTQKKALTVHRAMGKDVQIIGVRVSSTDLTAKIVSERDSKITRVEVAMLESMPIGSFYHKLFIDYTFEGQKATQAVRITGEVLGDFSVSPRNLFFGLIDGKKAVTKTVTISHLKSQAFKIIEVQSDSKYITFKVIPLEGKRKYHIRTTINPGAPKGELSDKIHIKTDSAIQPDINVPLYCIVSK